MNIRLAACARGAVFTALLFELYTSIGPAQSVEFTEDFTHPTTAHRWYFFNGACLTAGTNTAANPGNGNGCTAIRNTYYSGEPLVGGAHGTSGPTQTLPDNDGSGALRLTNGCTNENNQPCTNSTQVTGAATYTHTYGGGHHQNGAIISQDTLGSNAGINITFKTITYRGDTNSGGDGADGISFFLMDGGVDLNQYADNFGAFGGSLGYTCNNGANYDFTRRSDGTVRAFDGIVGGYIALGIDEWGNFLNQGDNTASGWGYQPGRVGLRGAGNIAWKWLNTNQSTLYPSGLSATAQGAAVANTCKTGYLWDYSTYASTGNASQTTTAAPDYQALSFKIVQGIFTIAKESAVKRGSTTVAADVNDPTTAIPITYNLKITPDNLLSLSYSYNGGAYQPVITGQSILNGAGNPPSSYRFGFAGSTGGASNIHEIMCFKAAPDVTSQSSGGVNVFQNPTLKTGTQIYLAYYFPSDSTGQLTAQAIGFDTTVNKIVVAAKPTWDARCVLSGATSAKPCSTGATNMSPEDPTNGRVLTWNGSRGIPLTWAALNTNEQSTLDAGDSQQTSNRLDYLRGVTTNEITSTGTCPQLTSPGLPCFRKRDAILGDIVDSSPTWVGPAQTFD